MIPYGKRIWFSNEYIDETENIPLLISIDYVNIETFKLKLNTYYSDSITIHGIKKKIIDINLNRRHRMIVYYKL